MKPTQRYLIAKYVPDPRRMEPRNIGVMVWASGRTAARFLRPEEAWFVDDKKTYQRWMNFWNSKLSSNTIKPLRGDPVKRNQPEFVDAILKTQKGNYQLDDAGFIVDQVKSRQIQEAADFLFQELIQKNAPRPMLAREQNQRLKGASELFVRGLCTQTTTYTKSTERSRPMDDDEPITTEWLYTIGAVPIKHPYSTEHYYPGFQKERLAVLCVERRLGWLIDFEQDKNVIAAMLLTNRGDIRSLLKLLNIPTAPASPAETRSQCPAPSD